MNKEEFLKLLTEEGAQGVALGDVDPGAMLVVFASHQVARMLHSPAVLTYAHFEAPEDSEEPDGVVSFAIHPDFTNYKGFTDALRGLADKLDEQQATLAHHGEMARQMRDEAQAADSTKH